MYRLNITFIVEPGALEEWMELMRSGFLPYVRREGFPGAAFSRVLTERHEGHFTFSLLVELDSMAGYERFTGEVWEEYLQLVGGRFGEDVLHLTTLLKQIDDE